ncbi:MAG: endonuclease/exonuclease/phosphatase family protein [Bacteriovoracaceae bacterium]|nr:endonuclease/exonuclease/phosphatase family protein [Bacteriovoracaceae bacterium]
MLIKILTYNIHKGFDIFNRRFILANIKQQIRLLNPDVVCLQEVQGEHEHLKKKVNDWPLEAQFEFLADTMWPHHTYGKNAVYPHGHHGNALLSKYPIKYWHNLDLTLDKSEMRGMLHAEIYLPDENRTFHMFNTHINLFHRARVKQAKLMHNYINEKLHHEAPFVLVGDFNDWLLRLDPMMREGLKAQELFHHLYGSHARTFPCFLPKLPLDRVYVRHAIPVQGMVLKDGPWKDLSDHLPIYAEVEV